MFLVPDGTAIIQLINFVIFFAILNVVFLRPVGAALKRRREYIDSVHADFDRYSHQVSNMRAQADAERLAARREAEEAVQAARAAAEAEAARIAAEYEQSAGAIAERARAQVAEEMAAARGREDELARQLASTLLERATETAR
jgi:F0F1-type ATP synthase membrane subunit b/b'